MQLSPLELKRLIKKGESQELDFKKRITHLHKIAKTITSFANSNGGKLLIGVDDHGHIIGVDPEEELYLINQAAQLYCEPPVPIANYTVEDKKENWRVLIIDIPESKYKPHQSADMQGKWKVYIRTKDRSMIASKAVIRSLKNEPPESSDSRKARKLNNQEEKLVQYLEHHDRITSQGFSRLVNISDRRARRILVSLVKEGLIYLHDLEKETYYTMA